MARKYAYKGGKIERMGDDPKAGGKKAGGKAPAVPGDSPTSAEAVSISNSDRGFGTESVQIGANPNQRKTMEEELRGLWARSFGSLGNRDGKIHATLPDGSRKVVERGATGFLYNDPGRYSEEELAKMKNYKF